MAHFELAAGRVSRAVAHHTVEEIWYILSGRGRMWRRQGDRQETVPLRSGTCISIPQGTHFQFRADSSGQLEVGHRAAAEPQQTRTSEPSGATASGVSGGCKVSNPWSITAIMTGL